MSIFNFAQEAVDSAVGLVTTSLSQIGEANQSLLGDFNPIAEGAWIGKGSVEFQGVIKNDILPGIQSLVETTQSALSLTKEVASQIKEADSFLDKVFDVVEDIVDAITPW